MFKIDNATAAVSLPTPAAPGPNPNGFFQTGTIVTSDWLNAVQEEISYCVTNTGGTLSKTDRTQLYTAFESVITAFGGLTSIQQDTAPVLGGNLDVSTYSIVAATGNIVLSSTTGTIDLNAPTVLVHTDIQHLGDTTTKITFGAGTQDFRVLGSSIFDISSAGFRLGGSNARVTTIENGGTLTNSSTKLATQAATKSYIDAAITAAANKVTLYVPVFTDTTLSAGNTIYFANGASTISAPGASITTAAYCWVAPVAGNITYYSINLNTDPGNTRTVTLDVYKNGASASQSTVITGNGAGSVTGSKTFTLAVAANDNIVMQAVMSALATSSTRIAGYFIFTPT